MFNFWCLCRSLQEITKFPEVLLGKKHYIESYQLINLPKCVWKILKLMGLCWETHSVWVLLRYSHWIFNCILQVTCTHCDIFPGILWSIESSILTLGYLFYGTPLAKDLRDLPSSACWVSRRMVQASNQAVACPQMQALCSPPCKDTVTEISGQTACFILVPLVCNTERCINMKGK